MPNYKPKYINSFYEDVDNFSLDKNIADGLKKAIPIILEKPYYKSDKVHGGIGLMRKHVCANRFRIFYFVDNNRKEVIFTHFRPKDKNTYKNL